MLSNGEDLYTFYGLNKFIVTEKVVRKRAFSRCFKRDSPETGFEDM